MGSAHYQLGEYRIAIQVFDRLIAAEPNDGAAHYWRGVAHTRCRDWNAARIDFDEVIRLDRDKGRYSGELAAMLMRQRDYEKAANIYTNLLRFNPKDARALVGRSSAYPMLGKSEEARGDIARLNVLGPHCEISIRTPSLAVVLKPPAMIKTQISHPT